MTRYSVSKAIITVDLPSGDSGFLMSLKSVPGPAYDLLEFLGGRHDPKEEPLDAMIRELAEEEMSGKLSRLVEAQSPKHYLVKTEEAKHFLFSLRISEADYFQLEPNPEESLGYELVYRSEFKTREPFTPKTRQILNNLLKKDPKGLLDTAIVTQAVG